MRYDITWLIIIEVENSILWVIKRLLNWHILILFKSWDATSTLIVVTFLSFEFFDNHVLRVFFVFIFEIRSIWLIRAAFIPIILCQILLFFAARVLKFFLFSWKSDNYALPWARLLLAIFELNFLSDSTKDLV